MKTEVLLVDLDNTLYDWVAFYVPSLLAMAEAVAADLGLHVDEVFEQLRDVYGRHGSVEYAFAVQGLAATRALDQQDVRQVVCNARAAFAHARQRHLRPYPGVDATLRIVREEGTRIVAATNAPLFQAQRRLRHLGLSQHFDGIAARMSFVVPLSDPAIPDVAARARQGDYRCQIPRHWSFDDHELKPARTMYLRIFEDLDVKASSALVVGDSLAKDVQPALDLGARGAWARYGTTPHHELLAVLLKVTPWSSNAIAQQYRVEASDVPTITCFEEVLDLL